MQTAVEGDAEHSRWLLEKGADMNVHTGKGYYPEFIGGKNGLKELFDEFKGKTVIRKLPEVPRLYKILVLDPTVLSKSGRRKLPKVIRKNIDWGLKKVTSPNLNQYTHIVIPKKNIPTMRTLLLEEDDVFMWKCLASMANLMDPNWFKYMITDLKVIEQEQNQMLQHVQFNGKVHLESLLKLKTDFHKGMPGFLFNVSVFFLPTKTQKELEKQEEWKEVIHMLNGTIATEIIPNEKRVGPYHTMSPSYRKNIGKQNKCWIIKYEDSIIDPIWRSD